MKPLEGLKVLDLSMGVAGPHAGLLCAQYGAEVVKIEPPEKGDWSRLLGRRFGDLTASIILYNRGKRSLSINLKDPEAAAIVAGMAEEADVIIENFRPGVMKRFGLDYDTLRQRNPRLIFLSVTGYGQTGPLNNGRVIDVVMQAFSGLMHLNRDAEGTPQRLDMVPIDTVTGLYGFQAITTALLERHHTGVGKHIDCSMMQSALAFQALRIMDFALEGKLQNVYVPLGTMATSDGFLAVGVMHNHDFVNMCEVLERSDLATNPLYDSMEKRVERAQELMPILREAFKRFTTNELVERLDRVKVLNARVLDYKQVLAHPQVKATSAVSWLPQDGLDFEVPIPNVPGAPFSSDERSAQSPHTGEHSRAVLEDWGVTENQIEALLQRNAITCSST